MNKYANFQENLEKQSTLQSIDSGLRVIDPVQVQGQAIFSMGSNNNDSKIWSIYCKR